MVKPIKNTENNMFTHEETITVTGGSDKAINEFRKALGIRAGAINYTWVKKGAGKSSEALKLKQRNSSLRKDMAKERKSKAAKKGAREWMFASLTLTNIPKATKRAAWWNLWLLRPLVTLDSYTASAYVSGSQKSLQDLKFTITDCFGNVHSGKPTLTKKA